MNNAQGKNITKIKYSEGPNFRKPFKELGLGTKQ